MLIALCVLVPLSRSFEKPGTVMDEGPNSRLADVERADWLLLDQALDNWNEPNRSMEFGSDAPNTVVRDHFELAKQSGTYLLYRRKKPANQ